MQQDHYNVEVLEQKNPEEIRERKVPVTLIESTLEIGELPEDKDVIEEWAQRFHRRSKNKAV